MPSKKFTPQERVSLSEEIKPHISKVEGYVEQNRFWDIICKVGLMLVTLIATGSSAYAATFAANAAPLWLRIANPFLAALATGIAVFVNTDFNFSQRQQNQQRKAETLIGLLFALKYTDQDKDQFVARLNDVLAWGDRYAGETNLTTPPTPPES
jgi:hypothetical protein